MLSGVPARSRGARALRASANPTAAVGKCSAVSRLVSRRSCTRSQTRHKSSKARYLQVFLCAEWTRTTTDHAVHKALNRIRGVSMGPGASRSSILRGLPGALDGSGWVDVLKVFSRADAMMRQAAGCAGAASSLSAYVLSQAFG